MNKELYDWLDKMENYNNKKSYKTIKQLRKANQELYSKSVKFLKSKVKK
jgi:glutathionyl-hydroquinone reductase